MDPNNIDLEKLIENEDGNQSGDFKKPIVVNQPVKISEEKEKVKSQATDCNDDDENKRKALLQLVKHTYILRRQQLAEQLNIKNVGMFDKMDLDELTNIYSHMNTLLYFSNNIRFMDKCFFTLNRGLAKVFGLNVKQLDSDTELRTSVSTSQLGSWILSHIPPVLMPVIQYTLTILKIKMSNKKDDNDDKTSGTS